MNSSPAAVSPRYKHFVFISYSRKDSRAAKWLQRRLEWFRFPVKLVPKERQPTDSRYVRPVYRDKTSLEHNHEHYWSSIEKSIERSRYMIVLCSPDSASSGPVDREVAHFLASHAFGHVSVVPVLLRGHMGGDGSECNLCPSLRRLGVAITGRNVPSMVPDPGDSELEGWENGFIGVASYLLGLERDMLVDHVRRDGRRQVARARAMAGLFAGLTLVASGAGVLAYRNGIEARNQRDAARLQERKTEEQRVIAEDKSLQAEIAEGVAREEKNRAEVSEKNALREKGNAVEQARLAGISAAQERIAKNDAEAQKKNAQASEAVAKSEKKKAEESENKALLSKTAAEDLVASVLFDFRDKLGRLGRLDLMDDAVGKVEAYFKVNPPTDAQSKSLYAVACANIGECLWKSGDFDGALKAWTKDLEIRKELSDQSKTDPTRQLDYAHSLYCMRHLFLRMGRLEEALACCEEGLEICRKVSAIHGEDGRLRREMGMLLQATASIFFDMGIRVDDMNKNIDDSMSMFESSVRKDPSDVDMATLLSQSYILKGEVSAGKPQEACGFYMKSLFLIKPLADRNEADFKMKQELAEIYDALARADSVMDGERSGNVDDYSRLSIDMWENIVAHDEANSFAKERLCAAYLRFGSKESDKGHWEEAREIYFECLRILEPIARKTVVTGDANRQLAVVYSRLGDSSKYEESEDDPDYAAAIKFYEKGLAVIKPVAEGSRMSMAAQRTLFLLLKRLYDASDELGFTDNRKKYRNEALAVADRMIAQKMSMAPQVLEAYEYLKKQQ